LVAWSESGSYGWVQPSERFKDETMTTPGTCSGLGAPDGMLKCIITGWTNYRDIAVDAFFGSREPTSLLMSVARSEVDSLKVSSQADAGGPIAFESSASS